MNNNRDSQSNIARYLLLGSGIIFILSAVLYNEFLLALFDRNPPLEKATVEKLRLTQIYFLLSSVALISLSEGVRRISLLKSFVQKTLVTNMLLATLSVILPLFILEFSLRPFVKINPRAELNTTTIFVKDHELGWRLNPNAEGEWGGVVVKINGKGLRGPELDYTKPSNVERILYLGDSVTFGFKLESYEQAFPYLVEVVLEDRLGYEIETINAGVSGYAPWQEYIYLSKEGIKYEPDLVVVSFVLNDVTEKFGLIQFGGLGEGSQLERTAMTASDEFFSKTGIGYFTRKISARIRFGTDIQPGAQQKEVLDVESLAYYPYRPDVQRAWKITLEELGKIFDLCLERDFSVILVLFPYTFQFDNIDTLSTPQMVVSQYAFDNGIPVIDLLPILSEKVEDQGAKPEDYFLDVDHLSPVGHEIVSEIIADFIQKERLIVQEEER